nr:NF-kappa-B inhibitor epsilon-like [Lytechinus pictus]
MDMEGFTLDSDTVKDCGEPAVAARAASHFQAKMGIHHQQDQDRCESTCDSAYLSESTTYSSVSDRLQDLHIEGQYESESSSRSSSSRIGLQLSDFQDPTVEKRTENANVRPQKRPAEEVPSDEVYLTNDAYDQDEEGDTPLSQSIIHEKGDIALKFIRYTPNPDFFNIRNCLGQTALMLSVLTNQPNICRALVVAGASVDVQDQGGNAALHLACRFGFTACIQQLTSPIQQIEIKNTVSARNHRQAQSLTLQLRLKNYEGLTCVHLATLRRDIGLLTYLVAIGANVNEPDGKSGRTSLHYAVEMNDFHLVQCLLCELHADVDAVTFDLCTPLHLAAGRGHEDIACLLHGARADTQVQNFEGQCAYELTNIPSLKSLLSQGHEYDTTDYFY